MKDESLSDKRFGVDKTFIYTKDVKEAVKNLQEALGVFGDKYRSKEPNWKIIEEIFGKELI